MGNVILPIEIVNKILLMRPKHPIAKILEPRIKECRNFARMMFPPSYDLDYLFRHYFYITSFRCFRDDGYFFRLKIETKFLDKYNLWQIPQLSA